MRTRLLRNRRMSPRRNRPTSSRVRPASIRGRRDRSFSLGEVGAMRNVWKLGLLLIAAPAAAQTGSTPPPASSQPTGCATPESRQFDFWVGKWEVHPNGSDKIMSHSLVEN